MASGSPTAREGMSFLKLINLLTMPRRRWEAEKICETRVNAPVVLATQ